MVGGFETDFGITEHQTAVYTLVPEAVFINAGRRRSRGNIGSNGGRMMPCPGEPGKLEG